MILGLDITWVLLIALGLLVFSYIIFILIVILLTDKKYFNKRMKSRDQIKNLDASKFDGLNYEDYSFYSNNNKLIGKIYYHEKQFEKIIIFSNGYRMPKEKYLPIINELALNGFTVVSYDYTGTDESEGKSFRGMPQAIIDLENCIQDIRNKYSDCEITLVGHSMGAYASCNVLNVTDVKKVVAIAPPNHVVNIVYDNIYQASGKTIFGFCFALRSLMKLRFKKYGGYETYQTLKYVNTNVLIIHGTEDKTVLLDKLLEFINFNTNSYVRYLMLEGKQHEPLMTVDAINYDLFLKHELTGLNLQYKDKIPEEELIRLNKKINYDLKNQLDKEILDKVIKYIKEV